MDPGIGNGFWAPRGLPSLATVAAAASMRRDVVSLSPPGTVDRTDENICTRLVQASNIDKIVCDEIKIICQNAIFTTCDLIMIVSARCFGGGVVVIFLSFLIIDHVHILNSERSEEFNDFTTMYVCLYFHHQLFYIRYIYKHNV